MQVHSHQAKIQDAVVMPVDDLQMSTTLSAEQELEETECEDECEAFTETTAATAKSMQVPAPVP